jgi:hypothetical protein
VWTPDDHRETHWHRHPSSRRPGARVLRSTGSGGATYVYMDGLVREVLRTKAVAGAPTAPAGMVMILA